VNKIGPAIFCFALLCVAAQFLCLATPSPVPECGAIFFLIGWVVIGAASMVWGIYSLVSRRWSGLFFLLLGVVELLLLSPVIHTD
jgi:hypothetical protein